MVELLAGVMSLSSWRCYWCVLELETMFVGDDAEGTMHRRRPRSGLLGDVLDQRSHGERSAFELLT